jgi:uncharacterized membrane protein YphA (DoxX/SURF4 family)
MESAKSIEKSPASVFRGEAIYYCIARLLLGGTLVFSSTQKFPMHTEFVNLVNAYHLIPVWMATIYATALPWVELLVGSYLLLGILTRPTGVVAGLISISFVVANISAIIRGDETCLHCFGQVIDLTPVQALTIDLVMIGIASYLIIAATRANKISFDSWFARKQRSKATAQV